MASAISFPVRSPEWVLTYQGTNITADISSMVERVSYTDYLSELSGEVELVIEDHSQRWQAAWYPTLGDQISLAIGYHGEGMLPCGDFQIDQLELDGPPDTFTMRCLAAFITPAMRTLNSAGYEHQSLLGIARTIAGKYRLQVISAPSVIDVTFERVTQRQESDLRFLKRLALEHDYDFTVRGSMLVFYSRSSLEGASPVRAVHRNDVAQFEFRNRTDGTYRAAQVAYRNFTAKSLIVQSAAATAPTPTGDVLKVVTRCENARQASLKAQAALRARNSHFVAGSVAMPGTIAIAAGNTIELLGFGEFDGTYLVIAARHRLDRVNGYRTRLEIDRVF